MDPLCLVTEYLSCGDLYHFIHNPANKLDWPLRLKIASDIASGMSFLHSAKPPIIHRDLKTPNVLLASTIVKSEAVAKVSDFGLSGAIQTVSNMEVSNPRWLAPEVMQKDEPTEKADVYSFGVILWELLVRDDFFGDTQFNNEIEKRVIAGKRPPIPADTTPAYSSLIQACWANNPKTRPTFKEIKAMLMIVKAEVRLKHPEWAEQLSHTNLNLTNSDSSDNLPGLLQRQPSTGAPATPASPGGGTGSVKHQ